MSKQIRSRAYSDSSGMNFSLSLDSRISKDGKQKGCLDTKEVSNA